MMRFLKQATFLSLSKLLEKACSFLIIILLARTLTTSEIGVFFFYFSLVCLFLPMIDLGMKKVLIQNYHTEKFSLHLIGQMLQLKIFSYTLVFLTVSFIDWLIHQQTFFSWEVIFSVIAVCSDDLGQFLRAPDQAREKFQTEIIIPLTMRLLALIAFLTLAQINTVFEALFIYALVNLLGAICCFLLLAEKPLYHLTGRQDFKGLIRAGLPFSLTSLCVMVSFFVDTVILGIFSKEQTGLYNSAFRIIVVFTVLSGGFSQVLFSKFSKEQAVNDKNKIQDALQKTNSLLLVFFVSLSFGVIALSQQGIEFLYDSRYSEAANILVILAPFIVLSALSNVFSHTLEAIGQQKKVLRFNTYSCCFNVVANIIFIPLYGMYAAAVTTVLTELLNTFLSFRALKKTGLSPFQKIPVQMILVLLIMLVTAVAAHHLELFHGLILGTFVFLSMFIPTVIQMNKIRGGESCVS